MVDGQLTATTVLEVLDALEWGKEEVREGRELGRTGRGRLGLGTMERRRGKRRKKKKEEFAPP